MSYFSMRLTAGQNTEIRTKVILMKSSDKKTPTSLRDILNIISEWKMKQLIISV